MWGWGGGRDSPWGKSCQDDMNLYSLINLFSSCTPKMPDCMVVCLWEHISCVCLFLYVRDVSIYSVHACLSAPPRLPPSLSLAVGDGGAAAQLDDHLLAVVQGSLVSQLLQGAGRISQHAHPLAGSRQKGGRKVAARQHHSLRLLPLARSRLTLLCTHRKKNKTKQTNVVTVLFRGSFWMSSATNSQSDFLFLFNYWWDLVQWTIGQNRWEAD